VVTVKLGDAPERCVNNRRVAKMIRWLLEHQAEIQATERGEIILSYAGDSLIPAHRQVYQPMPAD